MGVITGGEGGEKRTRAGVQLIAFSLKITKSSYRAGPLVRPALKSTSPAYLLQILPLLLPLLLLLLLPQLLSLADPLEVGVLFTK